MRTIRPVLAGLVVGLLVGLGLVVLVATPSYACSCVPGSPAQYVKWSDTVFIGTLADVAEQPPDDEGMISSMDPTTYTFEDVQAMAGDLPATVEVESARFGASCGLEGMQAGVTYVVFASAERGRWEASLCGGTRPADGPFVDRVAELTGADLDEPGSDTETSDPPPTATAAEVVAALLAFLGIAPA